MRTSEKIEVILKISEVCNIACDYCYYYFSGDDRPLSRPSRISDVVIQALLTRLNDGFKAGLFATAQIDFHGGEPLMIGPAAFEKICEQISRLVVFPYRLCITTNGMLIDERWISVFEKHKVNVCISVDGPADIHDLHRKDKRGRPTYKKVIAGLERLQEASQQGRIDPPAALCVVEPDADGDRVYRHIVRTLGLRSIDFLLPDVTHNSSEVNAEGVARFMRSAMAAWLDDDDADIKVRIFSSVLSLLTSGKTFLAGFGTSVPYAITVGSDGTVDADDFLKPCGFEEISTSKSIITSSLAEILDSPVIIDVSKELERRPDECLDCALVSVCNGGQATHRFSRENRFNNPSVYCEAQKEMFKQGLSHLLMSGVDREHLKRRLILENS